MTKITTKWKAQEIPDLMEENTAILHIKVDGENVHVSTLAPYDNDAVDLATMAGLLLERALEDDDDIDLLTCETEGNA
tara:strand:+ start:151 stop:384 length:234 start_codon:yes stop_codon:yes gene_type:complete